MILGINAWSFGFALGSRQKRMTIYDLFEKAKKYKVKGVQVGANLMPPLGTPDFERFREEVRDAGFFWEVSAGIVSKEGVLRALDYAVALECPVVRSYLEGFGIQFRFESLDEYVAEQIAHIKNLIPHFEKKAVYLCLENHGGLRIHHFRQVFESVKSKYLGMNLDTGNAVLTLEDPLEIAREFAPKTYTVHLKDWKLVKQMDGILVRGCALGDGVVDLPAVIKILEDNAPFPTNLHLNIESPQEYIPLKMFTSEFWKYHRKVTGREIENILALTEKLNADPAADYRIAVDRGASGTEILKEEESVVAQSARYAKEILKL